MLKIRSLLLSRILSQCSKGAVRVTRQGRKRWSAPPRLAGSIELMEERTLLSTFTVANTNDSGSGSLRQAILDANNQAGADKIEFAIAGAQRTIKPLTALPNITDPVTIDGSTQAGYADGAPVVVLSGSLLQPMTYVSGLTIDTSNSLIKGLVINGFSEGSGIVVGSFGSTGVTGNRIEGNIIGLNKVGTTAALNSSGITISNGASQNVVGGVGAAGNVISGNGFGIAIGDPGTSGNMILGNAIGTSRDRTQAIPNGYGIGIGNGATENVIGGSAAGEGNLISGNENNGILIDGIDTANNQIRGNRIGTNSDGTASLGNFTTSSGIGLSGGTHGNLIGGINAGDVNQIAGIASNAIAIADAATHANTIQGNYLGVSADGLSAVPNNQDGIFILDSPGNIIGGTTAAARNVISGSARHGITIFGTTATGNTISGNYIGTNATGTAELPNASDGIRIDGASGNLIGGLTPSQANVLSGNGGNGVTLTNAGTSLNTVQGNLIGVAADGTTALGNGIDGVAIGEGATSNLVGGVTASEWNTIAFNDFKGVEVTGDGSISNRIIGNRIYSNQILEIDLGPDGVTPNDLLDDDNGPNGLQNYPILTSANSIGGQLYISGKLSTKPNATYTLTFYVSAGNDENNNSQGELPIGQHQVTTDANGDRVFTAILASVVPGQVITATATDNAGNTSEFSVSQTVTAMDQALVLLNAEFSLAENSPVATFVGELTATDPDLEETLTYSITAGNELGAFALNSATGQITVANSALLDLETHPVWTLSVRVADSAGATANATATINLTNVNEGPNLSDAVFSLAENSAAATLVGGLSASDPDLGDTLTYSIISGNTLNAFVLNPGTGVITVANDAVIDFETHPTWSLSVQVTDGNGLSDTSTVTINLTNVNEAPQLSITGGAVTFSKKAFKKTDGIAIVPTLSVTDPDQAPADQIGGGTLTVSVNAVGKQTKKGPKFTDKFSGLDTPPNFGTITSRTFEDGQLVLTVHLNDATDALAVRNYLRGIKFSTSGAGLKRAQRTFQAQIADAGGAISNLLQQTVNVTK